MRVVVLDGYTLNPGDNPWDSVAALGDLTVHDRTPPEEIVERSRGADIILTNKTPLTAKTLAQLPDLKFIAVLATGFNVVDVEAARARKISVSNVPIYGTDSVAQFAIALLLHLCHHAKEHSDAVKDGEWGRRGEFCFWDFPLIELAGKTMGIIGFGRIGRRTGELAHALNMNVLASDPFASNPPDYKPFAFKSTEEVFSESDVISLHCPQTPDNAEFVNKELLGKMKSSAFFINTSRGGLVNEADMAEALNTGQIAGAALDVVSAEPIQPDNPLLKAKNIVLTPHMAWGTLEGRSRLTRTTADNIRAFLDGKPINVVN